MKSKQNDRVAAPAAVARPHMSVAKKLMVISLCTLATVMAVLSAAVGYAYFTKEEEFDAYFGIDVGGRWFDELNDAALETYQTDVLGLTEANLDAAWGSEQNPYVISESKHLYNLSALQNSGYLYKKHVGNNFGDDGTYNDGTDVPYFLICDKDGKPVCIEAGSKTIAPIGTEEFPFVGSVKGSFVDTTECTIADTGLTSDTSVIYNYKVVAKITDVDVGLFGYVGYIGTETTNAEEQKVIDGFASTLSDMLLYDVTITVDSTSWGEALAEYVTDHIFSYRDLAEADAEQVAHETHHLGILVGHVEYTEVSLISVYYSSDDTVAIDLNHASKVKKDNAEIDANYMSISGIIGYMSNMNPTLETDGDGIIAGSGVSNSGVLVGGSALGGGGGLLTGNLPGYVIASEVYSLYSYEPEDSSNLNGEYVEDTDGTITIMSAQNGEGVPLCKEWMRQRLFGGEEETGRFYFTDGVFTFALSGNSTNRSTDVIEPTWWNEVVDDQGKITYNSNPDVFQIGSNTDLTKWQANSITGQLSKVAYVRKITNNKELRDILSDVDSDGVPKKKIFIMQENASDFAIMSLSQISTAIEGASGIENRYAVPGEFHEFGDQIIVSEDNNGNPMSMTQQLYSNYSDGTLAVPSELVTLYGSEALFLEALAREDIRVIPIGSTGSGVSEEALRQKFEITAKNAQEGGTFLYNYFNVKNFNATNESEVPITLDGAVMNDYMDYADASYSGYFYYIRVESGLISRTRYYYFWQSTSPADGYQTIQLNETASTEEPTSYFTRYTVTPEGSTTANNISWGNAPVYTSGDRIGVVVNLTPDQTPVFLNSNNQQAFASGRQLTQLTGTTYSYFLQEAGETVCSYSGNSSLTNIDLSSLSSSGTTVGGIQIYTYTYSVTEGDTTTEHSVEGVLVRQYPTYTFSNGDNTLRLLSLNYTETQGFIISWSVDRGTYYPLWNGPDANVKSENFSAGADTSWNLPTIRDNSTLATLKFLNDSDGACYIQYVSANMARYVSSNGSAADGISFVSSTSETTAKLSVYVVEGYEDTSYGRVTLDPVTEGETDENITKTYPADEYVLFAGSSKPTDAANTTYTNNEYTLISIDQLNWKNDIGQKLSAKDLNKKFRMTYGLTFGYTIQLGSLTLPFSEGLITAPVGSENAANIPQSCVALYMTEVEGDESIRVIVAVAASDYYMGESGYNLGEHNRYFNIWKMEDVGEDLFTMFESNDYLDRFSIPRSHPYKAPVTDVANQDHIQVNVGSYEDGEITKGTTTYRSYLNGDRVLIAYEFKVADLFPNVEDYSTIEGVYILGASGLDASGNDVMVPMEIVYCSADGIASAGRDSTAGSQMGSIDYVYSNDTKVLTVKEESKRVENENGTLVEDPTQYYYPSNSVVRFDNSVASSDDAYVSINDEIIRIKRWQDINATTTTKTGLNIHVTIGAEENTIVGVTPDEKKYYVKATTAGVWYDVVKITRQFINRRTP